MGTHESPKQTFGYEDIKEANRGLRTYMTDAEFMKNIDEAFKTEVDGIYGKRGFMGIGKAEGVNTKEWGLMARLPANKIVEYATGDSKSAGLDEGVVKAISGSSKHQSFIKLKTLP